MVPSVVPVHNVYTFRFSPLEVVTEIVVRRISADNALTICEVDVFAGIDEVLLDLHIHIYIYI